MYVVTAACCHERTRKNGTAAEGSGKCKIAQGDEQPTIKMKNGRRPEKLR